MTTDTKPKTIPPEKAECFAESRKTIADLKSTSFFEDTLWRDSIIDLISARIEELDEEIMAIECRQQMDIEAYFKAIGARDELKRLAGFKVEE